MLFVSIGLEVHFRLKMNTKLFSSSSVCWQESLSNKYANIVDLAFPGSLPCLNKKAIFLAIKFGIAINAEIYAVSIFDRKHYFYPDLPKGYQITQHKHPIIKNGYLDISLENTKKKRIFIKNAHLEEDSGRLLYFKDKNNTFIDFNRAGVALLEVVTEPVFATSFEVVKFLQHLYAIIIHLNITDGVMQKGSFRCDVNISVRTYYSAPPGTRVEIKNINSFKFVKSAIIFEVGRQIRIISKKLKVLFETRFYDSKNGVTKSLRFKDFVGDYRYFSEPDLLAIVFTENFLLSTNNFLEEFLKEKMKRFSSVFNLSERKVNLLFSISGLADYFELVSIYIKNYDLLYTILVRYFLRYLRHVGFSFSTCIIKPYFVSRLILLLEETTILKNDINHMLKLFVNMSICFFTPIPLYKMTSNVSDQIFFLLKHLLIIYYVQIEKFLNGKKEVLFFFVGKILLVIRNSLDGKVIVKLVERYLLQIK